MHLDTPDAWDASDWEQAEALLEDLRVFITELPVGTVTMSEAIIEDQKASGTHAGSFISGAWRDRELNTIVSNDDGIVSLSSNEITIASAGTYAFFVSCPANVSSSHQCKLLRTNGATWEQNGTNAQAQEKTLLTAIVTCDAADRFMVQHRTSNSNSTSGLGFANNFGDYEVYTHVHIRKLS